ncbi:hypothetical protein PHET_02008 [Paragonimus heterotremus]|uniref:Uncharacterized protein n=1 Tax=Paragonimus heterotremus TaxID=100268 RepID=A0A8J4T2G3_9TREM|nr:hypothetical protein PHET_02008 [Paragonimus heterotremus]
MDFVLVARIAPKDQSDFTGCIEQETHTCQVKTLKLLLDGMVNSVELQYADVFERSYPSPSQSRVCSVY